MNKSILSTASVALCAALCLSLGACAVERHQETVGAYVDDATVTTKVKARLAQDSQVSATAISVQTLNGTVELSGFAKSADEKMQAERDAYSVSGAKIVHNSILVRP